MKNLLIAAFLLAAFFAGRTYLRDAKNALHLLKGDGVTTTSNRTLNNFNGIASDIAADIVWQKGESYQADISGPSDIVGLIETKVDGDKLTIGIGESYSYNQKITIVITSPAIQEISMNGSGNFSTKSDINGDRLTLTLSGSGNANLNQVFIESLNTELSGSGNLSVSGKATKSKFNLSGSGNFDAKDLQTQNLEVDLSGSGNIDCNVSDRLNVEISGSGNVKYFGQPATDVNISGAGKVFRGQN